MRSILVPFCIVTLILVNMPLVGYAQEIQNEPESESSSVNSVPDAPETDSGQTGEKTADLPEGASSGQENQEEGKKADGQAERSEQQSLTAVPEEQQQEEQPSLMAAPEQQEEQPSLMAAPEQQEEQPSLMAAPEQQDNTAYDYDAGLYAPETSRNEQQPGGDYPGVYEVEIDPNHASAADAPTIGIPSIADQNLDEPTTESPAIIQGAAVGYEEKTGAVDYTTIKERVDPYSEFDHSVMEEKAQDGSVHKKLTGFDGTYVILRLNVEKFFSQVSEAASNLYLHVKQEKNLALLPGMGMTDNNHAFADSLGSKTGSYRLEDLLDQKGKDLTTPYVDVLMFATGKLAAGADSGKTDQPDGDIPIHFYMDNVADYNPGLDYNPQSTDPGHEEKCLAKFYDVAKTAADSISNYLIKGSDLALEVAVENSGGENKDKGTTYWSVKKAFEDPYYDLPQDKSKDDPECGRTLKMISEVPIVDGLTFEGTDENHLRKRTLDDNRFDVQVANNTTQDKNTYSDGITLKNAWLTIADKSNTTGAEVAIGNNAKFVIDKGGKLIIDETCQLEIEWDGATASSSQDTDTLNNGQLDLRAGGEIVNNGIITIEGTEGKPGQEDSEKGYGEFTIEKDAKLTNNGSMVVYGKLYNMGTLVNNGKYDDLIISNDPDKGQFKYHKGIQIAWKDDVTQDGVEPGSLLNGKNRNGAIEKDAFLLNNGDILLNPGIMENYGLLINKCSANIYLAAVTEAIIPTESSDENSAEGSKRITLSSPKGSSFYNYGTLINNGNIVPATVELNDDGSFGELSTPGDHPELFDFHNEGIVINNGYIYGWGEGEERSGASVHTGDMNEKAIYLYVAAVAAALCGLAVVTRRKYM